MKFEKYAKRQIRPTVFELHHIFGKGNLVSECPSNYIILAKEFHAWGHSCEPRGMMAACMVAKVRKWRQTKDAREFDTDALSAILGVDPRGWFEVRRDTATTDVERQLWGEVLEGEWPVSISQS